jgi:transposase
MESSPPQTPKRVRRKFTPEFKASAVRLARQPGANVSQVARDLEIGDTLLRNWINAADAVARGGLNDEERLELARLRRENRILRENEAILKKAAAFFAREVR